MLRLCRHRILLSVLIIAGLAGTAAAQGRGAAEAPTTKPAAPMGAAAGPVLTIIPEQASLFVAVKNITDMTGKVDTLLTDIGLGMMAAEPLLKRITEQENFGPGFNANGGFALVVLDPALLGYKPEEFAEDKETGEDKPAPLVYVVPCTDLKTLWLDANASQAEGLTRLEADGEVVYGKLVGGYAVLGEGPKSVNLVAETQAKRALAKMSKPHLAVANQADVVVYADVKALQPWIKALADKAQKNMDAGQGMAGPWGMLPMRAQSSLKFWVRMAEQMDALTIGLNVNKNGLVINRYVTFAPQSKMARMTADLRMSTGVKLTQMPNLPYVLAAGSADVTSFGPQSQAACKEWLAEMLNNLPADKVSKESKDRLGQLAVDVYSQVKSVRVFVGGAPKDSGVFGAAIILNTDKPDAILEKMPEIIKLKQEVVNALLASVKGGMAGMAGMGPMEASTAPSAAESKVTLKYTPAALNVAGVSVATVDVDSPKLAQMEPDEKAKMAKVFGEGQVRVYIAKASDKSVVITFGGAQPFLTEVIAAAKGGRDLSADAAVATSVKEMPSDVSSLAVFSVPNLLQQIKNGVSTVAGPEELQNSPLGMLELKPGAPVAIGRSVVENGDSARVFIPTEMLGDLIRAVMTAQMGPGGPGGPGPRGQTQPGQHDF